MNKPHCLIEALEARIAPAFLSTIPLAGLAAPDGAIITAEFSNDATGYSVHSAGDFNGDGLDDFILGAPSGFHGKLFSGSAYLIYGVKAGLPSLDLGTLVQATGFRIDGALAGDEFGSSVAGAGDLNHDGFADLIIGAPAADPHGSGSGSVYVVFGTSSKPSAVIQATSLVGPTGFRLDGEAASGKAGTSVAAAGDVNGDGFDDVIIGAPGDNADSGAAYVLMGHAGSFPATSDIGSLSGLYGYKISGFNAGERAGSSVAGGGDVNGDGFAEVVVGSPAYFTDQGAASVLFGHAGPFVNRSLHTFAAPVGFQLLGGPSGGYAGTSVAGVGDLNGDGFSDLIVGAPDASSNGLFSNGTAYVIYGKSGVFAASTALGAISGTAGFGLVGHADNAELGSSVSFAGDFNHDGLSDLIIGAPSTADGGTAYVVFGTKSGFTAAQNDVNLLTGPNGFSVTPEATGDHSGFSVSGAGDVNGDGMADLLVGNYYVFNNNPSGKTFLLYGTTGGNTVTIGKTGKTATYTDVDGDLVTITTTKGPLVASEFQLSGANALGGSSLLKIDFTGHTELDFTNLTIKAKPVKTAVGGGFVLHGDGLANVGDLEAPSLHFGTVSIGGDIGQFSFGLTDGKSAAKSFTVNSIGLAGLSTQIAYGAKIQGFIGGGVPAFTVKTSVDDALLIAAQIGSFNVGGSMTHSKLFVSGLAGVTVQAKSVALKTATIGGDLDHSQIYAGPGFGVNPDVSIGSVTINGNLIASNIVAGAVAGADGVFGTADDAVAVAGGVATVTSTIASVIVKGQALGTFAPGGQFGIVAQKIGAVKINGTSLILQKNALDQLIPLGSTGDFFLNEIA